MYQKEAMWRQLQQYKRRADEVMERLQPAEASAQRYEASLLYAGQLFSKIQDDLRLLIASIASQVPPAQETKGLYSALLKSGKNEHLVQAANGVDSLIGQVASVVQSCAAHEAAIDAKLSSLFDHGTPIH